jgi:hypothetical protein
MNWPLLLRLIATYVGLFFLASVMVLPGRRYLRRRFQAEFGLPPTDENIAALQPEQLARWESISVGEFRRTPYRWVELLVLLFHYPSIVVLGFLLRQETFKPVPMFLVTGATHVTIYYFRLHH